MACKFRVKPRQNIDETYLIALREIERFGAIYKGDANGGTFKVDILRMRFKGTVNVQGDVLVVEIFEKPLLIPCSLIETSIKTYVDNLR